MMHNLAVRVSTTCEELELAVASVVIEVLGSSLAEQCANAIQLQMRSGFGREKQDEDEGTSPESEAALCRGETTADDEDLLLLHLPEQLLAVEQRFRNDLSSALERLSDEQIHLLGMALLQRCGGECSALELLCGFPQSAEAVVLSLAVHSIWERRRAVSVLPPSPSVRVWLSSESTKHAFVGDGAGGAFQQSLSLAENMERLLDGGGKIKRKKVS